MSKVSRFLAVALVLSASWHSAVAQQLGTLGQTVGHMVNVATTDMSDQGSVTKFSKLLNTIESAECVGLIAAPALIYDEFVFNSMLEAASYATSGLSVEAELSYIANSGKATVNQIFKTDASESKQQTLLLAKISLLTGTYEISNVQGKHCSAGNLLFSRFKKLVILAKEAAHKQDAALLRTRVLELQGPGFLNGNYHYVDRVRGGKLWEQGYASQEVGRDIKIAAKESLGVEAKLGDKEGTWSVTGKVCAKSSDEAKKKWSSSSTSSTHRSNGFSDAENRCLAAAEGSEVDRAFTILSSPCTLKNFKGCEDICPNVSVPLGTVSDGDSMVDVRLAPSLSALMDYCWTETESLLPLNATSVACAYFHRMFQVSQYESYCNKFELDVGNNRVDADQVDLRWDEGPDFFLTGYFAQCTTSALPALAPFGTCKGPRENRINGKTQFAWLKEKRLEEGYKWWEYRKMIDAGDRNTEVPGDPIRDDIMVSSVGGETPNGCTAIFVQRGAAFKNQTEWLCAPLGDTSSNRTLVHLTADNGVTFTYTGPPRGIVAWSEVSSTIDDTMRRLGYDRPPSREASTAEYGGCFLNKKVNRKNFNMKAEPSFVAAHSPLNANWNDTICECRSEDFLGQTQRAVVWRLL